MTIVTIYSLFGSDVNALAFSITADTTFWVLSAIAFVLFTIEIIFASLAKDDYWMSFYFWLDLISTISIIMDIGWIVYPMMGISLDPSSGSNAKSAAAAAKAGQSA